ncbi:hypothetical protein PPYR_01618 [Photinus pyralis]|uniref:Origin recognition complex subunit 1 n=1 Tax=Photinus pyralis TaxID=7054 RepID=A0A1Y1MM19_PHOPY|nr:origin recognition complex subunit 1 [Photinus pyralis]KAB0804648.1 hypothetical protein PPYR_01618 [Photinus pyralis]
MGHFKWVGGPIQNGNTEKCWLKYYQGFVYKKVPFNVGDFVAVMQKGKLQIGKLTSLFHSSEKRHLPKEHRGIVQLYKRVKDLDFNICNSYKNLRGNFEIIETALKLANTICLEEIIEKCDVVFLKIDDPIFQNEKHDTYCCRYKQVRNTLVPVLNNFDTTCRIPANKENIVSCANSPTKRKLSISCDTHVELDTSPSKTMHLTPNKVQSPVSPTKTVKLTPECQNMDFLEPTLSRSVKRVLVDSFDEELSNVCYSVKNLQCHDGIKLTLVSENDVKVFPTQLTSEVMNMKSPIKINSVKQVDNQIQLSEIGKMELRKRKTIEENSSTPKQTPAKISLRRSTRTMERKSYADFFSPPLQNASITKNDTPVRRSKRTTNTPKRCFGHLDESGTQKVKSTQAESSPSIHLNGEVTPSTRSKRLIKRSTKYSEETYESTPKKHFSVDVESSPSTWSTRARRKSEVRTPKKYNSDIDFLSDEEDFEKKSTKNIKNVEPKTPKRFNGTPLTKDTPTIRARMVRDGTITPSVQDRKVAILKNNTPLSNARHKLHVSYLPQALACREKEFQDITNFLEGKLLDGCGGCMYVSGVPGTGKTATVTDVMKTLQQSARKKLVPAFQYITINGMKISEPRQAYVEIAKQLMGKTLRWEEAQSMLENTFVNSKRKNAIILVVDELDLLCTKRQDVVYNLLDWPTRTNARLIVITIANTMDLPERLLMGRVTSRLGLTRLTFQPYTYKQLQEIVTKRIMGTNSFDPDAVQLVSRKVASVSGDARRALDICRRAAEIAENEGEHSLVSLNHVNQVLNAMTSQPKVLAIKLCCRLEKLLLQAIVAEVERTGIEETSFGSVYKMLSTVAILDGFQMVPRATAMRSVARLGASRFLLIDNKCNNIYNQRIMLNISSDDVHYALSNIVI